MSEATLAQLVKTKRAVLRMTTRQLGAAVGVSAMTVSKIERGKIKQPTPQTLRGLARALRLPYDQLADAAGYRGLPQDQQLTIT